jgi:diguanylate cyclase (GGDEF)-like protein
MDGTTDPLSLQDRERAKDQTAAFWTVSLLLTLGLLAAFPPTHALGTAAGWSIAGGFAVVTVAYIVRLRIAGPGGELELLVASSAASIALGVDQWLAGGFDAPFQILFTMHVLGTAAVLSPRYRVAHLAVVGAVLAAPLVYDELTAQYVVMTAVFVLLLMVEAALLGEFGERVRVQRLELVNAEREASRRATTDPLTGLDNRRALHAALQEAGPREPATVVYLDLNGFKAYNDNFGHEQGDILLGRLGIALATCVGDRGRAFRVGGDEFCVILAGVAAPDVVDEIVEALRESGDGYDIGASCGVVAVPRDAASLAEALRLADERMYADKRLVVAAR